MSKIEDFQESRILSPEENAIKNVLESENIEFFASANINDAVILSSMATPRLMPAETRGIIMFVLPYYVYDSLESEKQRNVARFAVGQDYHSYAEILNQKLSEAFKSHNSAHFVKVMCDHSPLDEKKCAEALGLGSIGKNRLIINSKYGSYIFLGEIFTSAEVDISCEELCRKKADETAPQKRFCSDCGACISHCPTFLKGNGQCLSALTQKKELSPDEYAEISKKKCKWGCDICQEVCPANKDLPETPIKFFKQNRLSSVTPEIILQMTSEDFSKRAYGWRGKKTILRNLSDGKDSKDDKKAKLST